MTDDNGLDFNQQETSDGGVVTGQYSVVLPDGRIQTVKYSVAPDTGYVVRILTTQLTLKISPRLRSRTPEDPVGSSSKVKQENELRHGRTFLFILIVNGLNIMTGLEFQFPRVKNFNISWLT